MTGEGAQLGAYVFRVAGSTLLDAPFDTSPEGRIWVATVWSDQSRPGGWGRLVWPPDASGRGWVIVALTHLGDVVEFGADDDPTDRWYGYVQGLSDTALILVGPYRDPEEAAVDGRGSLARWQEAERHLSGGPGSD